MARASWDVMVSGERLCSPRSWRFNAKDMDYIEHGYVMTLLAVCGGDVAWWFFMAPCDAALMHAWRGSDGWAADGATRCISPAQLMAGILLTGGRSWRDVCCL